MSAVTFLTIEEIVSLHQIGIDEFGGQNGIRDLGMLESAIYQPQQGFGGEDVYPTLWDKAGALAFSICQNHPFFDGNKRCAGLSALVFLEINGFETIAPKGELADTIFAIAEKKLTREGLTRWLKKNTRPQKRLK